MRQSQRYMQKVTFRDAELSTWDLARMTRRAPKTIWLDALSGKIPGMKRTAGGHLHFADSKALRKYVAGRKKSDDKGRRVLPPYLEALSKIGVLRRFVENHPMSE